MTNSLFQTFQYIRNNEVEEIGVQLLQAIQKTAVEMGYNKLSLYVEMDNLHAKQIYEKFGFIEAGKTVLPNRYHKHGLYGFYKLVLETSNLNL